MCLKARLEFLGADDADLGRVTEKIASSRLVDFHLEENRPAERRVVLSVAEHGMGCGCSFLRKSFSWRGPFWALRVPGRRLLAGVVRDVLANTNRLASFEARWLGPEHLPRTATQVSKASLLNAIEQGRVKPEVRYEIRPVA